MSNLNEKTGSEKPQPDQDEVGTEPSIHAVPHEPGYSATDDIEPENVKEHLSPDSARQIAEECAKAGLCIIPVHRGGKHPVHELSPTSAEGKQTWLAFKDSPPSVSQIAGYLVQGLNIAIMCGTASKGHYALDFDCLETFARWKKLAGAITDRLPIVQSGRGFHVYFRTKMSIATQNICFSLDEQGQRKPCVELRGEGALITIPPSIHKSGVRYKFVHLSLRDIPALSEQECDELLSAAKCARLELPDGLEWPNSEPLMEVKPPDVQQASEPERKIGNEQKRLITEYNKQVSIDRQLERFGYQIRGNRYKRPDGASESGSILDRQYAFSHSSSDILTDGKRHDAFDLLRILGCGGDVRIALEQAAQEIGISFSSSKVGLDAQDDSKKRLPSDEKGLIVQLGDDIKGSIHFAQDVSRKLYTFDGGKYVPCGADFVKKQVTAKLRAWQLTKKWSTRLAIEVENYLRMDAPELWEKPPLDVINLKNGLYSIAQGRLEPHSPTYLSTVQLAVPYVEGAEAPAWKQFVSRIFPLDAQDVAWEVAAWLLTPDTSIQKAVLCFGEGSNGKSTFLAGLTHLLGNSNVSNLSLHYLQSNRFGTVGLIGKLANICADLPTTHLTGTDSFKVLTGGDTIQAEYKGRDVFSFRPFARLVFSANELPRCNDPSHGFFRRWLVIPFDRSIDPADLRRREDLDAELASPMELAGLLNLALAALPRLRENGFTESPAMQKAWHEFRRETDPVSVWLESGVVEEGPDYWVPHADLYLSFCDSVRALGMVPCSAMTFGKQLKRIRPNMRSSQRTSLGQRIWIYEGFRPIGFNCPSIQPLSTQTTPVMNGHKRLELTGQSSTDNLQTENDDTFEWRSGVAN